MFASHGIAIQPHGAGEANIMYVWDVSLIQSTFRFRYTVVAREGVDWGGGTVVVCVCVWGGGCRGRGVCGGGGMYTAIPSLSGSETT